MKVPFTRFQSLLNENPKNCLPTLKEHGDKWCVVTEKIHGSNLSLYFTNEGIRFASRNQVLPEDTNFMNLSRFFTPEKMDKLHKEVQNFLDLGGFETLVIRGEIFGGHDAAGVKPVQTAIRYDGDIQFRVFAVECDGEHLYWPGVIAVSNDLELPLVPVIAEGPLSEMYQLEVEVPSVLCSNKDIQEGFCFRVENEVEGEAPIILKRRSEKFAEVKNTKAITEKTLDPAVLNLIGKIGDYITPQRLSNVNSHFGFDSMRNFGQLHAAFIEDVKKDSMNELGLDEDAWKVVRKEVGFRAVPLIKELLSG
ncbi:putative RNA ligase 2 [Aeromonas phage LAh_9]|uniref:RNA ligase 2 n=3 Tax=Lahexavirus TaxID=2843411 RepID=A0A5B9N4J7_9CAUD|nr:RNA ligase 2 [Aeromonas phage 4_4572]YP_009847293.1 putative RNA ligase 2 [Aeromonas phage LAh_6]YP_009847531.1 putative RNA ligase 2 [Aeromonas phage LAh_9]QDH46503.1 putative RNA ligase 2 [Aeromonas phage LAh_6]QDH46884.1 putative RNA ligase 2 [Aeromonas phage LAh_9]QEG09127.1 RNA ligase 2 [Aeromonas phage 4_4572]